MVGALARVARVQWAWRPAVRTGSRAMKVLSGADMAIAGGEGLSRGFERDAGSMRVVEHEAAAVGG